MPDDPPKDPQPYELESPAVERPASPTESSRGPGPSPGGPPASPLGESVLKDFDEDEDFDRDPERDAALGRAGSGGARGSKGKSSPGSRSRSVARASATSEDDDESDDDADAPFVTPGRGSAQIWGVVGGFLLVGAVVAASMNAAAGKFPVALLTLYCGLLHTATGLAAVYLTARLAPRPMGSIELAAARMFTAVAAFLLVYSLRIDLLGTNKWEELILAAGAYAGIVALLFRLSRDGLLRLTLAHFLMWAVLEAGMHLSGWAQRAASTGAAP